MKEILTVVDVNDNDIGMDTRENCHRNGGILHRAFLVLIFDDKNRLLTQQRSRHKELWPGYWDGSVASHVYPNETYESAAERRVKEELGITSKPEKIFKFNYKAKYGKDSENEICAILIGKCNGRIFPNKKEVSDYKFLDLNELRLDIKNNPKKYTPWFLIAFKELENLRKFN